MRRTLVTIKKSVLRLTLIILILGQTTTSFSQDDELDSALNSLTSEEYQETFVPPMDTVVFRSVPDTVIKNLQSQKEFAYANDPTYWVKPKMQQQPSESWFDRLISQRWFRYLIIGLLIVTLAFAVIKILIDNKIFLFRSTPKNNSTSTDEDDLARTDLTELIVQSETAGMFRMATRFRYMKLLQDLDARKLVTLGSKFTNWDYVGQLSKHPLNEKFRYLTQAYEYVWYGQFDPNAEQYEFLKTKFISI